MRWPLVWRSTAYNALMKALEERDKHRARSRELEKMLAEAQKPENLSATLARQSNEIKREQKRLERLIREARDVG